MTDLTVIILTKDEELHLLRALVSLRGLAARIIVVDSGSTDATLRIARAAGAEVWQHPWTNYAQQFNWALDQLGPQTDWVLRLDADEIVTADLARQINAGLPDVAGISVGRSMWFQGQPVRYGGMFPAQMLRLFRHGRGWVEPRWMDEHIIVEGPVAHLSGQIIDDNRKPLDWWIAKHNSYASREVVDILNQRHGFLSGLCVPPQGEAGIKRWIKTRLYARLPGGVRAGLYFLYRYILRLGFLDGRQGQAFHLLQGFWYRYLVDAKLAEVERFMIREKASPVAAIRAVLGIDLGLQVSASRKDAA
ncbi:MULTISPECIES: glycosyltransferase family 2 protein [unclassified Yoonia]|uniref:glycosyltransferase family 2 protein n=1 Tax=unclassified Yoonia TaxID=2629118 RepID=UPI002AFFFA1C|nr:MULTISPECIES: glycosyltransferase family 2 protein [unclassified Yoonia]